MKTWLQREDYIWAGQGTCYSPFKDGRDLGPKVDEPVEGEAEDRKGGQLGRVLGGWVLYGSLEGMCWEWWAWGSIDPKQWDFRERKRESIGTGRAILDRMMWREDLLQATTCIFYLKRILRHIWKIPSVVEKHWPKSRNTSYRREKKNYIAKLSPWRMKTINIVFFRNSPLLVYLKQSVVVWHSFEWYYFVSESLCGSLHT